MVACYLAGDLAAVLEVLGPRNRRAGLSAHGFAFRFDLLGSPSSPTQSLHGSRRCPEGWGGRAELQGINPAAASPQFRVLSRWLIRSGLGKGLWWLGLELGAQCPVASPTGEIEFGSAEQGIPGPQRVEALRGEPSARADCAPLSPASPPLPAAAAAVAMRCCETPVNKPCLEWSESPRVVCSVVRVQKSVLSPSQRLQALPLPDQVSGSDAGARPPAPGASGRGGRSAAPNARTRSGRRPPHSLPGHGKARKARPRWQRGAARSDARTAAWEQARSAGRGASGQSSLGRLRKVGAGTHGLIFDRMTSGCGRPRAWLAGCPRNPSGVWHPAAGPGRQGARALWEEREQPALLGAGDPTRVPAPPQPLPNWG